MTGRGPRGATEALLGQPTVAELRPRYEGSNICTWIGFKHVSYLVEEAVLEHFRRADLGARSLYEDHGLCVDIVELDTRILHAFHLDDVAVAHVTPTVGPGDRELALSVELRVHRASTIRAATSKVRVVLRDDGEAGPSELRSGGLARFVVPRIERAAGDPHRAPEEPRLAGELAWTWRVPYFYCHFSRNLQMSGYLRLMEEVVDLFLAERGISIRTLLEGRRWIPVVPHAAVSMLDEALMEEQLTTVFTVEDVFKDLTYTARMDCYVRREGGLVRTATGRITHGYAFVADRCDWALVNFDEQVLGAVAGATRAHGEVAGRGTLASEEGPWSRS
ncbi:MAG: thioesterase family protein [Actinomycetota bacterium]|nr:thioesterase family protein [Actinomycetota bacterium]